VTTPLRTICAWCPDFDRTAPHQPGTSHGICPPCQIRFEQDAGLHALEVAHPSGVVQTVTFTSAFARGLAMIALAAQPVTLRIVAAVLALLAVSATAAGAQTRLDVSSIGLTPYVLVVAGQGADLATTAHNYSRGLRESNPFYGSQPTLGKIAAVKMGEGAAMILLMKAFEKSGHPTAAKVIGYFGGIGGIIPAVINLRAGAR
jgi:hypothetical protein